MAAKCKIVNFGHLLAILNSRIQNGVCTFFERHRDIMAIQAVCNFDKNRIQNVISIVFIRNCRRTDDGWTGEV